MTQVGTPLVIFHMEVETEDCTCPRLPGCGGIKDAYLYCPEHGMNAGPLIRFHTHPLQSPGRINRGRHIA